LRRRQRRRPPAPRPHAADRRRPETGRRARFPAHAQPLGKRALRPRTGAVERSAGRAVHRALRRASAPARRDSARSRFHRRSHPRPAATQFLQRRLRPAHVSSHADLLAPHLIAAVRALAPGKRSQSRSHRAHAAAPGAAFAGRFPRRKNQTARRCRFRSAPAVPVLRVLRHRIRHRHPRQLCLQTTRRTAAETITTPLSPHPTSPAQLLQLPPPCPQLAASAPHLLQGRTLRRRNQPALRRDQPSRICLRSLRFLQRPRRVREPHRRIQKRLPRRPPQLPPLLSPLLPPAVAAALALRPDRNFARSTVQNRRPRPPHRPLHPLPPGQRLALPEFVPLRRARPQQQLTQFLACELIFLSPVSAEPCPKHPRLASPPRSPLLMPSADPDPYPFDALPNRSQAHLSPGELSRLERKTLTLRENL